MTNGIVLFDFSDLINGKAKLYTVQYISNLQQSLTEFLVEMNSVNMTSRFT